MEDAVAVWSLCLGGQERKKRFLAGEGAERVVCARERVGEILIVFSCCDANGWPAASSSKTSDGSARISASVRKNVPCSL